MLYFSPSLNCRATKAMSRRPNPSIRPQALGSDHGMLFPPHCRARDRQTILEMNSVVPARSIFLTFSLILSFILSLFGSRKAKSMRRTEMPPKAGIVREDVSERGW